MMRNHLQSELLIYHLNCATEVEFFCFVLMSPCE